MFSLHKGSRCPHVLELKTRYNLELVFCLDFIFGQVHNDSLSEIYVEILIFKLRYNSPVPQFTHLKWVLVYSQSCESITVINFRNLSSLSKEIPYPLAATPHSSLPAAPGNHQSSFCHDGFVCRGHFRLMVSCSSGLFWFFFFSFYHLACFQERDTHHGHMHKSTI